MKKSYVKPQVYFEDFQLSASIAAGCEVGVDTFSKGTCGYRMGDMILFTERDTTAVCNTPITDGENEYNNLCYHVPFDTNNVFSS